MAEEEQVETEEAKGPSLISKLVPIAITVLVPVILALVVTKIFFLPILAGEVEVEDTAAFDPIDPAEVTLRFEMPHATVLTESDDRSRYVLMYTVILVCSTEATFLLITEEEDRFMGMVSTIHRNRTKKLLDDPQFQDHLMSQTQEELNILLRRLRPEEKHEIREVTYLQFSVMGM